LLDLATDLAMRAGAVHRDWLEKPLQVTTKSAPGDLVSHVDHTAERLVIRALEQARPNDAILAEEGASRTGSSGVRWIIDPLDGTTNYVRGYPSFCASVAAEVDGRPAVGAVYEPASGTLYAAMCGRQATRNGVPIHVKDERDLSRSVLGTGFSYDAEQRRRQGSVIAEVIGRVADIRRSGSAALELCHVASGALDGFFELDLSPWDSAAGAVIAEAAGADVRYLNARHGRGPAVVAAHPHLIDQLAQLLINAGALA
jgi:myo-inositol-1(or 4)-monophosphatase